MPKTSQRSSRSYGDACPSTELVLPPTPASAGRDTFTSSDEHDRTLVKRKRSSSQLQDEDAIENRSCKSPRTTTPSRVLTFGGLDDMVDDMMQPLRMNVHNLESRHDVLETRLTGHEDAIVAVKRGLDQEIPALRTATENNTADINDLTRTSNERSAVHTQQLGDLTKQPDKLAGTVSGHKEEMKKMCSSLSATASEIVEARKLVSAEAEKQRTELLNHKSDTTKTIEHVKKDLKEDIAATDEELATHKTNAAADLKVMKTKYNRELRTISTELKSVVKTCETHRTNADKALGEVSETFLDIGAKFTALDRLASTIKSEVQQLLKVQTEAHEQTLVTWGDALKSSATEQNKRSDKITTRLDIQGRPQSALGAKIKSCEDAQANMLKHLTSLAARYNKLDKKHEEGSATTHDITMSLRKDVDGAAKKLGDHEDRLNHITADHLAFQVPVKQHLLELGISQELFASDLSIFRSDIQVVQETTDTNKTQVTEFQKQCATITSKHTLDIAGLNTRIRMLEDKVVTKLDQPCSCLSEPTPRTPEVPLSFEPEMEDMRRDVQALKVKHKNNENGLILHDNKFQSYKPRVIELEQKVKEMASTNEALSQKQTASEQKLAAIEEQRKVERAQDDKRNAAIFAAMQKMANEIGALKSARQAPVSTDGRLEEQIKDLRGEAENDRNISKSRFTKLERLTAGDAIAVAKLRSEVHDYKQDLKIQSTRILDVECRCDNAVDLIQEKSKRSQSALEKSEAAANAQLKVRCGEMTKQIEELNMTVDNRLHAKATNPIAEIRKLLDSVQTRAKMGTSVTKALEPKVATPTVAVEEFNALKKNFEGFCREVQASALATAKCVTGIEATQQVSLPIIDVDEFETFRNEYQVTIQAFQKRVERIEAALPQQFSAKLIKYVDSIRRDVDTLEQKRLTRDADVVNLRQLHEMLAKAIGSHSATFATKTEIEALNTSLHTTFATTADLTDLDTTCRANLDLTSGEMLVHIQTHHAQADQYCQNSMQVVRQNFNDMLRNLNRVQSQYQQLVSTPTAVLAVYPPQGPPQQQLQQQLQQQRQRQNVPFGGFVPDKTQSRHHDGAVQNPHAHAQDAKMVYTGNDIQGCPTTPIDPEQAGMLAPDQQV